MPTSSHSPALAPSPRRLRPLTLRTVHTGLCSPAGALSLCADRRRPRRPRCCRYFRSLPSQPSLVPPSLVPLSAPGWVQLAHPPCWSPRRPVPATRQSRPRLAAPRWRLLWQVATSTQAPTAAPRGPKRPPPAPATGRQSRPRPTASSWRLLRGMATSTRAPTAAPRGPRRLTTRPAPGGQSRPRPTAPSWRLLW